MLISVVATTLLLLSLQTADAGTEMLRANANRRLPRAGTTYKYSYSNESAYGYAGIYNGDNNCKTKGDDSFAYVNVDMNSYGNYLYVELDGNTCDSKYWYASDSFDGSFDKGNFAKSGVQITIDKEVCGYSYNSRTDTYTEECKPVELVATITPTSKWPSTNKSRTVTIDRESGYKSTSTQTGKFVQAEFKISTLVIGDSITLDTGNSNNFSGASLSVIKSGYTEVTW